MNFSRDSKSWKEVKRVACRFEVKESYWSLDCKESITMGRTRVFHPSEQKARPFLTYAPTVCLFVDIRGCRIWWWLEGLNWTAQEWKIDRWGSPYRLFDSIKPNPPSLRLSEELSLNTISFSSSPIRTTQNHSLRLY